MATYDVRWYDIRICKFYWWYTFPFKTFICRGLFHLFFFSPSVVVMLVENNCRLLIMKPTTTTTITTVAARQVCKVYFGLEISWLKNTFKINGMCRMSKVKGADESQTDRHWYACMRALMKIRRVVLCLVDKQAMASANATPRSIRCRQKLWCLYHLRSCVWTLLNFSNVMKLIRRHKYLFVCLFVGPSVCLSVYHAMTAAAFGAIHSSEKRKHTHTHAALCIFHDN